MTMTRGRPSKYATWKIPPNAGDSGVFAIECIATGKVYVGASKHIRNTLILYRSLLWNRGKMPVDMCTDYDKYGPEGFKVTMLEEWEEWDLVEGAEGVEGVEEYAPNTLSWHKRKWIRWYKERGVLLYGGRK